MNTFFFGHSNRPLFGVYITPRASSYRESGVVVCPPLGWEYLRGHRTLRQLGARLSDAGFHVLRFDYYGTGDSAGHGWDATLDHWHEDVSTAIDELKDTTGLQKVSVVGMRLGATLAARVAAGRRDIDRLVLWDPVVSGADYLLGLAALHPRLSAAVGLAPDLAAAEGALDVEGFALSATACDQINEIDLLTGPAPRVRSALAVATGEEPGCERLASAYQAVGIDAAARHIPTVTHGPESDAFVSTVMPTEVLDAVVDYFLEGKRDQ